MAPSVAPPTQSAPRRRRTGATIFKTVLTLLLVFLIAWPTFLIYTVNKNLVRVDALVSGPETPGTTYLLAGSDQRAEGDPTAQEGERSDSILLIHRARNGQSSMVSIPRDSYVEIPGEGMSKINAAFSWGGPKLLVATVQNLTGMTIDHYVQIDMGGFVPLVDAIGTVNLCMDMDVFDPYSGLDWEAGCHDADGQTALAFSRMRYEDPRGDLGRQDRQRQVISQVTKEALSPRVLLNPVRQWDLAEAGTQTLVVDEDTNVFNIAMLLWAFRSSGKSELTGMIPVESPAEMIDGASVMVLDEERLPVFFERMRAGTLTEADFIQPF